MDELAGRQPRAAGAVAGGAAADRRGPGVTVAGLSFGAAARLSGRASASVQRTMELVRRMDLIREYWWLIVIVVALVLAFILLRPRQRVNLTDSAPVRPHMAQPKRPPEGRGIAGEAAAATSDVTGDIIRAPVHRALDGESGPADDLCGIKGIGPKFADALHGARLHALRSACAASLRLKSTGWTRGLARLPAASRATGSSSRPITLPATIPTASNRSSGSFSRPPPPASGPASCAAGTRSACRSFVHPCRRSRTTSRRGGTSRRFPANV